MHIVVTDGYTLNPGDLGWDAIAQFGTLSVHDRTPVEEIVNRCANADIVLTNKVPLSKDTLARLPQLKLISVLATGYNIIDVAAASANNIVVCNVPACGTASVAQHTFALILELTNHTGKHALSVTNGEWTACKDFAYTKSPLIELRGKTIGIVGFGNIGGQVARIAATFGMKVLYHSTAAKNTTLARYVDLKTLFRESDIVSLHCPLKPDNSGFVNQSLLQFMKPAALLINTARGQLINEQDVADALNNNVISGAGLDVLSVEPPLADNPLLRAKNCIITPHIAWITKEARARIVAATANNIRAFITGKPMHRVN